MSTRLQREKGYRLSGLLSSGHRIIKLIRLPHKGVGRHQILTDRDYIYKNKVVLDEQFTAAPELER